MPPLLRPNLITIIRSATRLDNLIGHIWDEDTQGSRYKGKLDWHCHGLPFVKKGRGGI